MSTSNINDASNYKKCRKKLYEIYFCIPQVGTVFFNKLEQPDMADTSIFKSLKKEYLTPKEIVAIQKNNADAYKWLAEQIQQGRLYCLQKGQAVLAGTVGELYTITIPDLNKKYSLIAQNGMTQPISSNKELADKIVKGEEVAWRRIRSNPDVQDTFACFVPVKESGSIQTAYGITLAVNHPKSKHGLGDFVLAANNNGQPDLNDRWVVNGLIFASTYNNQGWSQYLASTEQMPDITLDKLPQWFNGADTEKQKPAQSPHTAQPAKPVAQHTAPTQKSPAKTLDSAVEPQTTQSPHTAQSTNTTATIKEELLLQIYANGGKSALVKAIKDTNIDIKELEKILTPNGLVAIKKALS